MSDIKTLADKQVSISEIEQLETEIAHHVAQLKIYAAAKLTHDFMHLEQMVTDANDPELSIKLFDRQMKIAGIEAKQQEKQVLPNMNIVINLGDGPDQGVTMHAQKPADPKTIDVDAEVVLMGAFSSLDTDDL